MKKKAFLAPFAVALATLCVTAEPVASQTVISEAAKLSITKMKRDFVIEIPSGEAQTEYQSHRSHYSHYSHYSHRSHYSSRW